MTAGSLADPGAREGGLVVWGCDQEPNVLNPMIADGKMFATSQIALSVLLPLWIITPTCEYVPSPLLASAEPVEEGVGPFSVTYHLNPDAAFSDGVPVTAGDVFFTLQTCLDKRWRITSRAGCDKVDMRATEAGLDPGASTITVVFIEPFGPWQTMFSTARHPILPAHLLEGEDFNTICNDELPVATGPFMFGRWDKGEHLTLVRNANYERYAGRNAYLDQIVFRFIEDSVTQVQELRNGQLDILYSQPQPDLLEKFGSIDGIESQAGLGPIWELLAFQQLNPALANQYVRRAIAMGIDRRSIVEQFIRPVNPDAAPLNSLVYVNTEPDYRAHFEGIVDYDPAGAIALLEGNGCERGDDGIFVCEGERLSFEWTAVTGNERRELLFEITQPSLLEIGVEITPDFGEAAAIFAAGKFDAGNWDLCNFAWVDAPDPHASVERWKCEGAQNYHRDCPPREIDEALEASERAFDRNERAELINEAGGLLAERVPALPLYQMPTYLAWNSTRATGLQNNPTHWGPVWNIADWHRVPDESHDPQSATTTSTRPTIRQGSTGTHVRYCQQRLRSHGFAVTVDGKFGPRTRSMVIAFQSREGLDPDGIVGPRTWRELG